MLCLSVDHLRGSNQLSPLSLPRSHCEFCGPRAGRTIFTASAPIFTNSATADGPVPCDCDHRRWSAARLERRIPCGGLALSIGPDRHPSGILVFGKQRIHLVPVQAIAPRLPLEKAAACVGAQYVVAAAAVAAAAVAAAAVAAATMWLRWRLLLAAAGAAAGASANPLLLGGRRRRRCWRRLLRRRLPLAAAAAAAAAATRVRLLLLLSCRGQPSPARNCRSPQSDSFSIVRNTIQPRPDCGYPHLEMCLHCHDDSGAILKTLRVEQLLAICGALEHLEGLLARADLDHRDQRFAIGAAGLLLKTEDCRRRALVGRAVREAVRMKRAGALPAHLL